MYFGAMAVGADLSAGLHTFYFAEKDQNRMHFVFKAMDCQFLKRAETDVRFISREGDKIKQWDVTSDYSKGKKQAKGPKGKK